MKMKSATILLGIIGILVILLLGAIISIYPDWLWFRNLNFAPVFWTMIMGKFGLAAVIWLLMIILLSVNLYAAQRFHPVNEQKTTDIGGMPVSGRTLNTIILAAILIVSFVIASKGSAQWNLVLSYLNQQPFGSSDPVFSRDIGFYVFSLPFYLFVREQLLIILLFAGLVTVIWYIKDGGVQFIGEVLLAEDRPTSLPKIKIAEKVSNHLLVLAGIMVLLVAWGYYLKVFGLLYSTQGPAFGASYTDVHVRILAYRALMVLSILWCLFLIYNAFKPKMKLLLISGGIWFGAILILANGLPLLVQQFVVRPNELAKESPYIAHNIDFTRKAYNLNNIKEVNFEVNNRLSAEDRPTSLPKIKIAEKVSNHLLVLAGIMVLLVAWGYYLKVFGLLYSTQGPAFGASYTDVHVRILAYRALMVLSILWCLFLIYNAFKPKMKLLLISGGIWFGAILILANGLPLLVQQFVVRPNELAKESPYIAHNIDFTRKAYNLNNIKEVNFEVNNRLSAEEIKNHDDYPEHQGMGRTTFAPDLQADTIHKALLRL